MAICAVCYKCESVKLDVISMPRDGIVKVHCFECGNESVHMGASFGRVILSGEQAKEVQADRCRYRR